MTSPSMIPPSLSAIAAFVQVARHANFSRAAEALEQSPSALSQTVRTLERQLGVRLFNRTTRRVALTEQGQRFLQQVEPGLRQIEQAVVDMDFARLRPAGHLRINLPSVVAERMIVPHLPGFRARWPDVQVELCVESAQVDLVGRQFDAGIRLGESLAREMVALPIGPLQRQVVVATPAYFQRHQPPATPADLTHHECVRYRRSNGRIMAWEFNQQGRDFEVEVGGHLIVNDSELALLLVRQGIAMAQIFQAQAEADLRSGVLTQVLQAWQPPFAGFHIYYPAREHLPPKLRVFIDYLREVLPPP